MLYLSEEVKLGIVSGAIGILILMVICMTCKLSRLHKQPIYLEYTERKADAKLPPTQAFPKYIPECSDCVREQLSQMSDETGQQPTKKPITVKSKGTIKFSMVYQSNVQTLLLGVIEANHLVGKDFWDTVDSYVKARLHPDADGVHKGQTDICRKSRNPKFGQTLEFNVPFDEIGEMTLLLSVWELDKYSRHRIIGEAQLELGHVIQVDEPVEFDKDLRSFEKIKANLGEILFSLSYLPTAERLSIVVMKARNLSPVLSDWSTETRPINPFVKVVLLFDGRKVKKKKTSTRKQEVNPVYNELMIFDVPPDLLHRVLFVISVADARRDSTRSDLIGRVVIGSATTSEPLRHWHQMLISPRKPVAAWHRLRL